MKPIIELEMWRLNVHGPFLLILPNLRIGSKIAHIQIKNNNKHINISKPILNRISLGIRFLSNFEQCMRSGREQWDTHDLPSYYEESIRKVVVDVVA